MDAVVQRRLIIDKGLGDIDNALETAGGVATDAASAGPRKGAGGDGEAATVDDLSGPGGGSAGDVSGPAVKVEGTVQTGSGEIDADHKGGTQMGKRYTNEAGDIEILCTKPGEGNLAVDGTALEIKGAKPLPSSD